MRHPLKSSAIEDVPATRERLRSELRDIIMSPVYASVSFAYRGAGPE
jgi:hypothetical protein